MAINLKSTSELSSSGRVIAVYGQPKSGKTRLVLTLPRPMAIGLEPGGLASLCEDDIPCAEAGDVGEFNEAMNLFAENQDRFDSLMIDSASQLGVLYKERAESKCKDGRQAYGMMSDDFRAFLVGFRRAFPEKHLYFPAKLASIQDETNRLMYSPSLPGKALGVSFPHDVDCIFALHKEGEKSMLQCQPDARYGAGTRVGTLGLWEPPDLGALIRKIGGTQDAKPTVETPEDD